MIDLRMKFGSADGDEDPNIILYNPGYTYKIGDKIYLNDYDYNFEVVDIVHALSTPKLGTTGYQQMIVYVRRI